MLNIWKEAVQNVQARDPENKFRSGEKRPRELQDVASDATSSKKARIAEAWNPTNLQAFLDKLQRHNLLCRVDCLIPCVTPSVQALMFFSQREKERISTRRRTAVFLTRDDTSIPTYVSSLREHCPNDFNIEIGVYEPSSSNMGQWEELSCKDVVVVRCHAMLDSLIQGELCLSQVHTLVISEGERIQTSDSDPVARIMTDFYHVTDDLSKPRILLMIASSDIGIESIAKFEQMFTAHLFTPSHRQQHGWDGGQEESFIEDPTTSRRLFPHHAPKVIGRVAAEFTRLGQAYAEQPFFEYGQSSEGSFVCTLILPSRAPFQRISGFECRSREDAKRSACYQTCRKLFDQGLLDYHHFPPFDSDIRSTPPTEASKSTPSNGEPVSIKPEQDLKRNGMRSYPRRSPDFWSNSVIFSDQLYPTVIFSQQGEDLPPIVLLTRLPLPRLPAFDLFFSGAATNVRFQSGRPFSIEHDKIRDLRRYTLRLHRIIGNKPFVCDQRHMPYFLAPLSPSWTVTFNQRLNDSWVLPDVLSHIPWSDVALAASKAFVPVKADSTQSIESELNDAVVQDRLVEYTRRYFILQIRHDLSPLHKPSEEEREAGYETYLAYCKARVSGFEGLKNPTTPLIEVSAVPGVLNRLDPALKPQLSNKGSPKFLIPELCGKCTVPASILKTSLAFPSILMRINELLLVKELNAKLFSNTISDHLLQTATMPPSAGADVNYERLEILGDALLKYTSSVYVFITHPSDMEGNLHSHRRNIVSNRALWCAAEEIGIPQFILSKIFSSKYWYPANYTVRASFNSISDDSMDPEREIVVSDTVMIDNTIRFKRHKEQCVHQLGDKTLADTVEAIIAAAYLSQGHEAIVPVMKALTVPVIGDDKISIGSCEALPLPPSFSASVMPPARIKQVETIIGYAPPYPYYLVQVLMGLCPPGFESTCLDRLEFLGDSILDFLTMKYIYDKEPDLSPGALTLLKSAMVSNSTLATMCVWSGIYKFVNTSAYYLGNTLQQFASAVTAKHGEEHQAAKKESRSPGQYWLDTHCPKIISDIMEAILGALYVSDNCSLVGAETFFNNVFKPFYENYITFKSLSRHATNTVLELLQKQGCNQHRLLKDDRGGQTRCRVTVHGAVLGEATDSVASIAMRKACEASLQVLIKDLNYLARTCNCDVSKNQNGKGAEKLQIH